MAPRSIAKAESALGWIARHEAGHAVAAVELKVPIERVSIRADETSLGRVSCSWEWIPVEASASRTEQARSVSERASLVGLSGVIAEHAYTNRMNWRGAATDLAAVSEHVAILARTAGERRALLEWLWVRARDLVRVRAPAVVAIAETLAEVGTLSGDEVAAIVWQAPLDKAEMGFADGTPINRRRLTSLLGADVSDGVGTERD